MASYVYVGTSGGVDAENTAKLLRDSMQSGARPTTSFDGTSRINQRKTTASG